MLVSYVLNLSVKTLVPNGYPNTEGVRRRPRDYDRAWIVINSGLAAARAQDASDATLHACAPETCEDVSLLVLTTKRV